MRKLGVAQGVCLRVILLAPLMPLYAATAAATHKEWQASLAEIQLSNEEFKKLDTFEAHTMSKADKVFAAKDYKRAAAEYDSFLLEFPHSKALAYALLRKARCLQLGGKRFEAIKEYNEVLDYFPNAAKYAAAALFYIGLAHWENADEEKAMAAWSRMAEDKDYSKQPLAAWAINQLADNLAKSGRPDKANDYFKQVAVDFRATNSGAAHHAIGQVVAYYVHAKPDEPALRAFHDKLGGFAPQPRKVQGNTEDNRWYWQAVRMAVRQHGRFPDSEAELRNRYYTYWTGLLAGKFLDWDDHQIEVANLLRLVDNDAAKWVQRIDAQFDRNQKDGDYARIVRWIRLYRNHKPKAMEYYNRLKFDKMTNAQIRELMAAFYDEINDEKLGRNTFDKLRLDDLADGDKVSLARYFWPKDADLVKTLCASLTDKELGAVELLRYYHSQKDAKNGVPAADQAAKAPRYAQEAFYKKAQLLQGAEKYAEAIGAYQQADNPPDNLWGIADCYAKMEKLEQAVTQLREVESFFKQHASDAAMRIARLYQGAGKEKLFIAALRSVLKKYPESRQSSEAHEHLERLGIKIGGGVDAQ